MTPETDTFIADTISDLVKAGATYSHIARTLGVSTSTVSRWRSGERHPSGHMLFRLARLHEAVVHGRGAVA